MVEKLVSNPFMKSLNWAYLQINSVKFYTASFHCVSSWGLLQYFETKLQTTCKGLILSFFEKQKKRSGISCLIFWIVFKENVYFFMFYYLTKLNCLVQFTLWDIGQYMYYNSLLIRLWYHKFQKAIFSKWSESQDKKLNNLKAKRAFKMINFSLKQVIYFFGRWEFEFNVALKYFRIFNDNPSSGRL